MKYNNKRKFIILLSCLLLVVSLCACGRQDTDNSEIREQGNKIYYLNKDRTFIVATDCGGEMTIDNVIEQLSTPSTNIDLKAPLQMQFGLIDYRQEGNLVILNFDENYYGLPTTDEVLVRAAIVRSIAQIENVECISFLVNGEALTDNSGRVIGTMTADLFLDSIGMDISNNIN